MASSNRKQPSVDEEIDSILGTRPAGTPADPLESQIEAILGPSSPSPSAPPTQEVRSAPEWSGWTRYPAMIGSEFATGLAQTLGTPGSLLPESARSVAGMIVNPGGALMGTSRPLPTVGELLEATGRAGLTQRADLIPSGMFERDLAASARGAGAAAPLAVVPGSILPTYAAGVAGGLGTQVGKDVGLPLPAAEGLGTVLGLGAGGATGLLGAPRTANAQAFLDAGLPLRSPALTSSSATAERMLGKGAPIEQTRQDLGDAIERVASNLSPARDWQTAGTRVQERAREWINPPKARDGSVPGNSFPALERAAWEPVDAAIPPTTLTPMEGFETYIRDLNSKGGVNRELIQKNMPDMVRAYDEIIKRRGPTGHASFGAEGYSGSAAKTPSWDDVRQLRSSIGDMMQRPSVANAIGSDTLDGMYSALTRDLEATATRVGALPEFQEALATSNELRNFRDQVLGKVTKSDTGNRETIMPGDAAKNMLGTLRKGDTSFSLLRHYLPEAADELSAVHLRQIGLAKPNILGSTVHADFPRALQNLENAGSVNALLPNEADRRAVRASADIADRLAGIEKWPDRATRMGSIFGTAGGPVGEVALGSAALAHRYEATGDPIYDLLLGGALGGIFGRLAPAIYSGGRNLVANRPSLAGYASFEKPGLIGSLLPAGEGSLAVGQGQERPRR